MPRTRPTQPLLNHEHIALVLQGGGALGAYQAGVFEEIAHFPREPHWVAGVSIGAINAALIVGNPPQQRVAQLREFWQRVSQHAAQLAPWLDLQRTAFSQFNAMAAATFGVNGFYTPRLPPPFLQVDGSEGALSFYDTAPLKKTLEELVDFDLINRGPVRLSVGAVNVRSGNSVYFDNTVQTIGPEHIMASGALPPGFAPVMIDGEPYWDGGLVSNTPLQYVLDNRAPGRLLVAQVDLFSARGAMPTNLAGVLARQKDIMYSSRTRFNTDSAVRKQNDIKALEKLIARLPASARKDPALKRLLPNTHRGHVDIVHLIYRQSRYELESKDYEFSRATMLEHWQAGQRDMRHTVAHPDWLTRSSPDEGITVYDLAHESLDTHSPAPLSAPARARRAQQLPRKTTKK
jgi:NTE family protein